MSTDYNYLPVCYTKSARIHKERREWKMGKSEEENVCHKDFSKGSSLMASNALTQTDGKACEQFTLFTLLL